MSEFEFPDFYLNQKNRVEAALERFLPPADEKPQQLSRSMRHSVLNGGKRLRGVLVLEAGRLGEQDRGEALELLAVVVELIHAYSLVHDDLPAMDDDDFRRGQPTCHRKFGEDIAILAGDALLTRAFELLGFLSEYDVASDVIVRLLKEYGEMAGFSGLVGGQVEDLTVPETGGGIEKLKSIHSKKTGALITACLTGGGLLSGSDAGIIAALSEFGRKIGLAFQIKDDLLDLEGDFEKVGKDINSDLEADKLTYPSLLGIEESRQLLEKIVNEAEIELMKKTARGARLVKLARLVAERDH